MAESSLVTIEEVRRIGVLGAGTMGHGIAQVAALAGFSAALYDVDAARAEAGLARIRANLDKGIARGKVEAQAAEAALARVGSATDVAEAVAGADVVIEAAPERLDVKQALFRDVDAAAPATAILATNTSSLSVARIAEAVARPGRLLGLHFFNPVHIMKLVEIIRHGRVAPEALACAQALVARFGKTGIVVEDAPGFASSRLGIAIGLEAMRMLEAGVASAADIDRAMKLGYGHPMGPLELSDLVGLDVRLSIAEYLASELGARFEPPAMLRRLVGEGKLGKKSGQGFYRWRDGKRIDD